jgi:hypothetical protein
LTISTKVGRLLHAGNPAPTGSDLAAGGIAVADRSWPTDGVLFDYAPAPAHVLARAHATSPTCAGATTCSFLMRRCVSRSDGPRSPPWSAERCRCRVRSSALPRSAERCRCR